MKHQSEIDDLDLMTMIILLWKIKVCDIKGKWKVWETK